MADAQLYTNAAIDSTPRYIKDPSTNSVLAISTGSVGIGTNSCASGAKLDVRDSTAQILKCLSDTGTPWLEMGASDMYTKVERSQLTINAGSSPATSSSLFFVASNKGGLRWDNSNSKLQLYTGGSAKVTIDNSGNVGIGTTGPSEKLEVNGNIKGSALIVPVVKPASDSTSALQLQTSGGTNVLNVDTTNQRVGIGTASPGKKLEVAGDAKIDGNTFNVDSTNHLVGIGTASPVTKLEVVGNAKIDGNTFNVDNTSHRVGIGTTSPSSKLHVANDGDNMSYLTLGAMSADGSPVNNGEMTLYVKGNKIVLALKKSDGYMRYTCMDMTNTGSISWSDVSASPP
jgi:hypothetical protein